MHSLKVTHKPTYADASLSLASLREQGCYKNGLREGLWKHYNKAGELDAEVMFKRGEEVKD